MPDVSNMELLRNYSRHGSETAFTELVQRHINLVYSVAFRHVGMAAQAEEITQVVFIILARKAAHLRRDTVLDGWLYETTRLTALSFLRGERRRQFREQEAYMQSILQETGEDSIWMQLAPLLDEAMSRLSKKDRDAVILRFFREKNVGEVAATMQMSEPAVQRRVLRALEKLRKFFAQRGVSSTTAIIAEHISANSVQAAPAALAKSVTGAALAKGAAASASTLTLIKGALKIMAWTKLKSAALAGVVILLASGAAIVTVRTMSLANASPAAEKIWDEYSQLFARDLDEPELMPAVERVMDQHPPMALIRLSPVQQPWRSGTWRIMTPQELGTPRGHIAMGSYLVEVVRYVFNLSPQFPQNHIIVPGNLAATRYDFIDTMPRGGREALRRALKNQFGLVATREMRPNLVMIVKNPNAGGLHKHTDATRDSGFRSINVTMPELANAISRYMGVKVTDQTGLAGGFDFNLDMPDPASPTPDDIKKALLDQLGLGLTPAADKQRVEFLVVEKMR